MMSPYFHAFSCWLHSLEDPPYVVGKKEVFLPIGNKLLKTHCQIIIEYSVQFSSVAQSSQTLCDPWTAACQTSLSITNSWSLPKFMSIESVMPSNHLTCRPLLFLPSVFPSIRVFSSESALCIKRPNLELQIQHQSFQWTPRTDLL